MYKYLNSLCPKSFNGFVVPYSNENRSKNFKINVPFKKSLDHFPTYTLPKTWNELGLTYKRITNIGSFKFNIMDMLICK